MSRANKALIYNKVPTGLPVPGQDLVVKERSFDLDRQPPAGGATVRQLYVSLDPYMRGQMRDPSVKSYNQPYALGEPVTAYCLVQVIKSDHPKYQAGDLVFSRLAVEEYTTATREDLDTNQTYKIDNKYNLPLSNFVGILGMPGITAYASLYEIGAPKKGETIFVSSAAGAVGQVVGQLAKQEGLRVIGSVGNDEKLKFITEELGFDGGFNYKKEKSANALARLAPDGVDIYYENVGGEQLEAALDAMNFFGRIVACGMVSQYNLAPEARYGIKNLFHVISKRIKMQGFIQGDPNMGPKYSKERDEKVSAWLVDGSIKTREDITVGIENGPEAFIAMLSGQNKGKATLKIADPE
ncbi:zinc-type alcohol dehydrogenase-like protein PB24D3.08c [Penicillium waksmanii]|uniref:zinc-type alcohol dehydrogenase-like protein PB24D3.08c n=1 Tax=Penicillium waksmanii TaxID=69791 RepID=UPI002546C093|nr:zinc-type alcohol dehydrogenase-like protein PB24D3.08c [Penicillium waksmanii]KAJ5976322.1 zinc-type alcohol dehydrogenase-like protein PB24D3.08c [Penicillium waksmanii]